MTTTTTTMRCSIHEQKTNTTTFTIHLLNNQKSATHKQREAFALSLSLRKIFTGRILCKFSKAQNNTLTQLQVTATSAAAKDAAAVVIFCFLNDRQQRRQWWQLWQQRHQVEHVIVALLSFVRVCMCVLHKCYDEKRTVREDWRDLNFSLSWFYYFFR